MNNDFRVSIPLPISGILGTLFAQTDGLFIAKVVSSGQDYVELETAYAGTNVRFPVTCSEPMRVTPKSWLRFSSLGYVTPNTMFSRSRRKKGISL